MLFTTSRIRLHQSATTTATTTAHRVFDTHCHIGIKNSVINRSSNTDTLLPIFDRAVSKANNVQGMTVVGIDLDTSRQCQKIIERLNNHYYSNNKNDAEQEQGAAATRVMKLGYSVGLHPHWANRYREEFPEMKKMILEATSSSSRSKSSQTSPRLVAIGETGLDYFKSRSPIQDQKDSLNLHLDLAAQVDLPVIIHCRNADRHDRGAHEDLFDILDSKEGNVGGVIHCFSDDTRSIDRVHQLNQRKKSKNKKWFVSFCCTLGYPRSHNLRDACAACRIEDIVIETDSPYLPPSHLRGQPNEPMHVQNSLENVVECKLGAGSHTLPNELRGLSRDELRKEIAEILWKNSLDLFQYN